MWPPAIRSAISLPTSVPASSVRERRVDQVRRQVGDQQRDAARREQRAQRAHVRAVERRAQLGETRVRRRRGPAATPAAAASAGCTRPRRRTGRAGRPRRAPPRPRRCRPARPASGGTRDHGSSRSNIPDASTGACATSWRAQRRRHARDRPRHRVRVDVAQVNLREARPPARPGRRRLRCPRRAGTGARLPRRGARSAISRVRRARCSANVRLVTGGALVRRDLLGDGVGELARLDHGSRRLTGASPLPCRASRATAPAPRRLPRRSRRGRRPCRRRGTAARRWQAAGPTQACVAPGNTAR